MTSPSKEFERLDRHIRTALTVNELAHWDAQRKRASVTRTEAKTLEEMVLNRAQALMGSAIGGNKR